MGVQRIEAKIVIEVAPHSNVIGIILVVVALDHARTTDLDAIVVGLAAFTATRPGEEAVLDSCRPEFESFSSANSFQNGAR